MSPANKQQCAVTGFDPGDRRFLVTGFDYAEWRVVVVAPNAEEAIGKAEALYLIEGFGDSAFEPGCSGVDFKAELLTQGAQS